jgi:hypothetical protein
MATERIVNVPINFKINTVEVEKYDNILKKADQSAEKLGQTSNRAAAQSAASFRATGSSIIAMRTDLERLKYQIESTSKADTQRLDRLSLQYKALNAEIQKQTKLYLEQGKAIKQNASSTQDLAGRFGELYNAARMFVAAGVAREVINISLNMALLAGNVEGVERAFNRIPNATLILADLRRVTRGTVTDLELMQKALMAQNYRIPLEKLSTLLEFAAVKAQQTGQEVNHLVDYIVTGIGLRSLKRLDDLGFTANRVKEALGGVSIQAASMGQIMSAVTKLMNEDLQKTGGYAETSATAVGRLKTAWHEMSVEVSNRGASNSFINFLTDAVDAVRLFVKAGGDFKNLPIVVALEQNTKLAEEQALAFQKSNEALEKRQQILAADTELFNLSKTLEMYNQQEEAGKRQIEILNTEIANLKEKNKSIVGLQKMLSEEAKLIEQKEKEAESINKSTEALKNNKAVLSEVIRLLVDYRQGLTTIVPDEPSEDSEKGQRTLYKMLFKKPKQSEVDGYGQLLIDELQKSIDNILLHKPLQIIPAADIRPMDFMDKLELAFEAHREDLQNLAFNSVSDQVNSILMAEVDGYTARIDAARSFYDEQVALAGDNERAKKELRIKEEREIIELEKRRADREKKASQAGILVNTALGVMKVFAGEGTFADKIVRALIVAAEGASQYAIASRARYYAKGALNIDGPGTKTSDSIPAFLSKGESVMTADETGSSMNILKSIRAKKLNDKVLKDLVSGKSGGSAVPVFDDSKIIKELRELKNATPDIELRAGMVYKGHKMGENYTRWIRSKSMGM